ncbi:MAG: hypothetical protein CMI53_00430 [Parcubacteria group bacterium]|jgi:hypothetical protein|nr:hypothetical protein [Parcubacteria group bacterium]|tara:strand:+ start:675 stop:914 length:240 start_codon:yes stop_codon:yes gene_type:complete
MNKSIQVVAIALTAVAMVNIFVIALIKMENRMDFFSKFSKAVLDPLLLVPAGVVIILVVFVGTIAKFVAQHLQEKGNRQ